MTAPKFEVLDLMGMPIACLDRWQLRDHVFTTLREGRGGWLITANLDFLRRWHKDASVRQVYAQADVHVADGMPLVWASHLQGRPLPERIAGSSFVWLVAERAAEEGRSLYLLGGDEGDAQGARDAFARRWPGVNVCGLSSPRVSNPPSDAEVAGIVAQLRACAPDFILVGLGSPKQELLIHRLREHFPTAWMMGIGMSFGFASGRVSRAPKWMQVVGLEWVHRLCTEPRRLARRYLVDDLPFAFALFKSALLRRGRRL